MYRFYKKSKLIFGLILLLGLIININSTSFAQSSNSILDNYDKNIYIMIAIDTYLPDSGAPWSIKAIRDKFGPDGKHMKIGLGGHIQYMRTKGRANEWVFDKDFDNDSITTASLKKQLELSIRNNMPIYFALNGESGGDVGPDMADWDVNDYLQQDEKNVQLNQEGSPFQMIVQSLL